MSNLFKICMFVTSFIPLWISILFIEVMSLIEKTKYFWSEVIMLTLIIVILPLSVFVMISFLRKKETEAGEPYEIVNAKQEKGLTSEFLLSYILPLFAFDFTEWKSVVLFWIYFLILAFLCIRNDNVYANLVLEKMHYKFYECDLLYSARDLNKSKQFLVMSKEPLASLEGTIYITSLNKPFYVHNHKSIFCAEETS